MENNEDKFQKLNKIISWKAIGIVNAAFYLFFIVFLSIQALQTNTENRSFASNLTPAPTLVSIPNYPVDPPTIERVALFYGKPGDDITILGRNFGTKQWNSSISIGGIDATKGVEQWNDTNINVRIPENARSGDVSITVNSKGSSWDGKLSVSNPLSSAGVQLVNTSPLTTQLVITNIKDLDRGVIQIAHGNGELDFTPQPGVTVNSKSDKPDNFGESMIYEFNLSEGFQTNTVTLGEIKHPENEKIEILRLELYNRTNNLIPVIGEPTN